MNIVPFFEAPGAPFRRHQLHTCCFRVNRKNTNQLGPVCPIMHVPRVVLQSTDPSTLQKQLVYHRRHTEVESAKGRQHCNSLTNQVHVVEELRCELVYIRKLTRASETWDDDLIVHTNLLRFSSIRIFHFAVHFSLLSSELNRSGRSSLQSCLTVTMISLMVRTMGTSRV